MSKSSYIIHGFLAIEQKCQDTTGEDLFSKKFDKRSNLLYFFFHFLSVEPFFHAFNLTATLAKVS